MRKWVPQFRISDLLWLTLAIAVATSWILEHRRLSQRIEEMSPLGLFFSVREQRQRPPSEDSIARQALLQELSHWTDRQLCESFLRLSAREERVPTSEFEPYLTELARRGLTSELAARLDAVLAADRNTVLGWLGHPDDFATLIALRRAQGQPDPLRVHLKVADRSQFEWETTQQSVVATVENVDVEQKSIYFLQGCDGRGGRYERWRVVLTDGDGKVVQDSNFQPFMGGGLGSAGPLTYGEKTMDHFLALPYYVAPP